MKQSFFPEGGKWRKANLHSHTTRTDGLCPPEQQIRDYCDQGYEYLAISDHNVIDCHQLGADADICMVPAWERDIRHNEANTKCIHVISYPARGMAVYAGDGELLTDLRFPLKGSERYIRIECIDQAGNSAWTNPWFFD